MQTVNVSGLKNNPSEALHNFKPNSSDSHALRGNEHLLYPVILLVQLFQY